MKNPDQVSPTRSRPDLRCITDKQFLYMDHPEPSPVKLHLKPQLYQSCDIPDQGGGNLHFAGFSSYINQCLTIGNLYDGRAERQKEKSKTSQQMKIFHSRSKSNVKYIKSDLKRGSFSDKQNIPKKGASNSKILLKKIEYKPLSPFIIKVTNQKPTFAVAKPVSKENKEEVIQPWRKYMRELGQKLV